jgi:14-3-3 protein epsilon
MSGTRDENVFMARIAEQAERYEDMVEYMKRVGSMGAELSLEERNLLSVAFKNSVGARRTAWRAVNVLEQRESQKNPEIGDIIGQYRVCIEKELNEKCNDVIDLLANNLVPKASDVEAKVFYLKMKGDYHRYLAEFTPSDKPQNCLSDAQDAYEQASKAAAEMAPTHPIRLGLALNFSVFYFEVCGESAKACQLAQEAFSEATGSVDPASLPDDSTQILQLLRDNLTLWTSDAPGGGRAPEQDGTTMEDF